MAKIPVKGSFGVKADTSSNHIIAEMANAL